jgi:hypothetical protein
MMPAFGPGPKHFTLSHAPVKPRPIPDRPIRIAAAQEQFPRPRPAGIKIGKISAPASVACGLRYLMGYHDPLQV